MRKTYFVGLTAVVLGLAMGTVTRAQQAKDNRNAGRDDKSATSDSREQQTIRGVVAAVTVEGELAIDYQTNRAAAAEMTFVTVVGSPQRGGMNRSDAPANKNADAHRDNDQDRNGRNSDQGNRTGANDRHRHNVYLVWITPRTKIRQVNSANSSDRNNTNKNEANKNNDNRNDSKLDDNDNRGTEVAIDRLEVGDHVELTFNAREDSNANKANANANRAARARHGRHRTHYGDAVAITILSETGNRDSANANRGNDRDRDDDRDRDNDTKKNKDQDSNKDLESNKK